MENKKNIKKVTDELRSVNKETINEENISNIRLDTLLYNNSNNDSVVDEKSKKTDRIDTISKPVTIEVDQQIVDLLKKMYAFMVKSQDEEKNRLEIESNRKQEKIDDETRRREKIIQSIENKKHTRYKKEEQPEEEKNTFFGKLFDLLKSSLGGLFSGLMSFGGLIVKGLKVITGSFMSMLKPLSFLAAGGFVSKILGLVTGTMKLVGKLASSIGGIVFSVLKGSGKLIFSTVWPILKKILSTVFKTAGLLGRGVGAVLANPIGAIAGAGALAYGFLKDGGGAEQERKLYFGDEVVNLLKRKSELETQIKEGHNPEQQELRRKEISDIDTKLPGAYDKYLNETVVPAMEQQGYKKVEFDDGESKARFVGFEKTDPETGKTDRIKYRVANDSYTGSGDLTSSLTSTSERNNAKALVGLGDQTKIESSILKNKQPEILSSLGDTVSQTYDDIKTDVENSSYAKSFNEEYQNLQNNVENVKTDVGSSLESVKSRVEENVSSKVEDTKNFLGYKGDQVSTALHEAFKDVREIPDVGNSIDRLILSYLRENDDVSLGDQAKKIANIITRSPKQSNKEKSVSTDNTSNISEKIEGYFNTENTPTSIMEKVQNFTNDTINKVTNSFKSDSSTKSLSMPDNMMTIVPPESKVIDQEPSQKVENIVSMNKNSISAPMSTKVINNNNSSGAKEAYIGGTPTNNVNKSLLNAQMSSVQRV